MKILPADIAVNAPGARHQGRARLPETGQREGVRAIDDDAALFEAIARNLETTGFSVNAGALPIALCQALWRHRRGMDDDEFELAGVGRARNHQVLEAIRRDQICWISGASPAGRQWLEWTEALKRYLNRRLFLGLFSFESHFAHYRPGAFYRRHYDAFHGEANRVLSLVVYLNEGWRADDGGELLIYGDETDRTGQCVVPDWGTIVAFLSEDFPHEVRPTRRDRYSIAGWYRLNSSTAERVDPPR